MIERGLTQKNAAPALHSVPSGLLQRQCACGNHTVAGGECEECRKKREGMLQRSAASAAPVNEVPPIVHEVLRSPGQPLDAKTRAFMEPRFGHDFSGTRVNQAAPKVTQSQLTIGQTGDHFEHEADSVASRVTQMLVPPTEHGYDFSQVRVHTDAKAAESVRAVNALAYTVGRDMVFGVGQYAPGTSKGQQLLAHELVHYLQQNGGQISTATLVQRAPNDEEADEAAGGGESPYDEEQEVIRYAVGAMELGKLAKGTVLYNAKYWKAAAISDNAFYAGPFTSDMGNFYYVYRFTGSDQKTSTYTLSRGTFLPEPNTKDLQASLTQVQGGKALKFKITGLIPPPGGAVTEEVKKETGKGDEVKKGGGEGESKSEGEPEQIGSKGDVGLAGLKNDKGEKRDFSFIMDQIYVTEYNSVYNRASNGWNHIAEKQKDAIESIKTEAKKPKKPDLAQELIIALAMAALGGAVNVIGTHIAMAIEKKAAAELGKRLVQNKEGIWFYQVGERRWEAYIISMDKVKSIQESTKYWAKIISEAAKDFFKDGVKNIVGPKIRKLLEDGKTPIDSFFEGLRNAATDAGKAGYDGAEKKRSIILAEAPDPISAAATEASAIDDIYDKAEETTKETTLEAWLLYQAQLQLGTAKTGRTVAGENEIGTDLKNYYLIARGEVPGVLYIYLEVDRKGQIKNAGELWWEQWWELHGLSRYMLRMIENKPIKELGIPIIFKIWQQFDISNDYPERVTQGEEQFSFGRNEKGVITLLKIEPQNAEVLARYGGATKPVKERSWWRAWGFAWGYAEWDPIDVMKGAEKIAEEWSRLNIKGRVKADKD